MYGAGGRRMGPHGCGGRHAPASDGSCRRRGQCLHQDGVEADVSAWPVTAGGERQRSRRLGQAGVADGQGRCYQRGAKAPQSLVGDNFPTMAGGAHRHGAEAFRRRGGESPTWGTARGRRQCRRGSGGAAAAALARPAGVADESLATPPVVATRPPTLVAKRPGTQARGAEAARSRVARSPRRCANVGRGRDSWVRHTLACGPPRSRRRSASCIASAAT